MKTPYEGSYFLLLGQVTLMLSALLFGLGHAALSQNSALASLDELSSFYLLFVVVACFILGIAVFIGWTSTSSLLRRLKAAGREDQVTNKLFTFDVLGIACLFMAANVLFFSVVSTYRIPLSAFQLPSSFGVQASDVGAVTAAFYLLNAIFLATCMPWNGEYFLGGAMASVDISKARRWLVASSLATSTISFAFFMLAPALGYPLRFDQSLRLLEIVFPVFLGYLGSAALFLFRPSDVSNDGDTPPVDYLDLIVKGPTMAFIVLISTVIIAFGYSNRAAASPGAGMTVDTLAAGLAAALGLLTATTNVAVSYLFSVRR